MILGFEGFATVEQRLTVLKWLPAAIFFVLLQVVAVQEQQR